MPLYEYCCTKCNNLLEVIQKFSDEPLSKCPECGGKLEKQLSAPAIQFKGSGWYITDYSNKGKESTKDSKSETKDKSTSTSDKKSDTVTNKESRN